LIGLSRRRREGWTNWRYCSLLVLVAGNRNSVFVVRIAHFLHVLMVLNVNLNKLRILLTIALIVLSWCWARPCGLAVDDQGVIIVGFDGDFIYACSWYVPVEVIVVSIFFEIKPRNEAIHKAVTMGEMTVEFINVIQNWGEISVDALSVATAANCCKLRER
jgi:hypothetical protein